MLQLYLKSFFSSQYLFPGVLSFLLCLLRGLPVILRLCLLRIVPVGVVAITVVVPVVVIPVIVIPAVAPAVVVTARAGVNTVGIYFIITASIRIALINDGC